MSYFSRTIKDIISDIDKKNILLPAIQREFVWDTEQIENLFDSLMRGYPIGTFLFWKIDNPQEKGEFYEFIRIYSEKEKTHNLKANLNLDKSIFAVLDGQQRLTSLYIGLLGEFEVKERYKRNYVKKKLYLNLLHKNNTENIEKIYDFRFLSEEEVKKLNNTTEYLWFEVGKILQYNEEKLMRFKYSLEIQDMEKFLLIETNLLRLMNVINKEQVINYYEETNEDLNEVLNIFVRVNSGGTKLSYSDLLLSIATSKWKDNAREKIIELRKDLNEFGFNFDKDFILKSALMLSDIDVKFRLRNFNSDNMRKIEDNWDNIEKYLQLAVELVKLLGFDEKRLSANNAVIPIAYYLYFKKYEKSFLHSDKYTNERKQIREWLVKSLLKRVFSGQSDEVLKVIREAIRNSQSNNFPINEINENVKKINISKSIEFDDDDIEYLLNYSYGKPFAFTILSLIYENIDFSKNIFHIDHIFPKSLKNKKKIFKGLGISEEQIKEIKEKIDLIPNLQLLKGTINQEKNDKNFKDWFNNLPDKEKYKQEHFIPDIELDIKNFLEFFEKRKNLLKSKLKSVLS
ncbi:hypothetical protein C3L23_09035 [Nautilia sp. PV-1]|uniref:DUF262 domain-containing protein n=1 Tax=Nautilia sp. PV-1 TaxID=2579250 RepID=UPI000FD8F660|nr:DUF262 domain-containing protein [Nautilia sp. PV-1]AZV47407.1 hypothetical protein C3L23_09035 [Nautilia sp. PV-1]